MNRFCLVLFWILSGFALPAEAYRLEVSIAAAGNMPVFLAGYYGDRVSVIDSARSDNDGKVVFARDYDLCPGIYTLVVPDKLTLDLLMDEDQQMSIRSDGANNVRITGSEPTAAYAEYLTWLNTQPDNNRIAERRNRMIEKYPGSFLAVYLKALQPIEVGASPGADDPTQMMKTYRLRRRKFFDNMNLSDVRLLRTPLYHERIQYYISKFVTQQTDTLIHVAYRMLERASGNYETFFYVSDFLIDFSLRSKTTDINKLHNFLLRNRDMVGSRVYSAASSKSKNNYFKIPDDNALKSRLEGMSFIDTEGRTLDPELIKSKFRILFFRKPGCLGCLAEASKWQNVLNKHQNKSCFGIAVNIEPGVEKPESRISISDPSCVNVSVNRVSDGTYDFFDGPYSKIIVTDTSGNVLGIFCSSASLDQFMSKM